MKRRMVEAGEYNLYTSWKAVYNWPAGRARAIKRRTHRRERREGRQEVRRALD